MAIITCDEAETLINEAASLGCRSPWEVELAKLALENRIATYLAGGGATRCSPGSSDGAARCSVASTDDATRCSVGSAACAAVGSRGRPEVMRLNNAAGAAVCTGRALLMRIRPCSTLCGAAADGAALGALGHGRNSEPLMRPPP